MTKTEKFLYDIVNIESPSRDKAAVDKVCSCIKAYAESNGYHTHVREFPNAGNGLVITALEEAPEAPVVFMGHMDTVHEYGKFNPVWQNDNGKVTAPGIYDCKGGIAVAFRTMELLKESGCNKHPLKLILTGDEEVSTGYSGEEGKMFIRDEAFGAAAAFNCECGRANRGAIVQRKGTMRIQIDIHGKAAHSGAEYFKGKSAVREAAYKIIDLEAPSDQNTITYNCGIIHGGGTANIVPDFCRLTVDVRYFTKEQMDEGYRHVQNIVNRSYVDGTVSELVMLGSRLPMERTADNERLSEIYVKACNKLGIESAGAITTGGGSDSAYSVLAGVPSICGVGIDGDNAHALNEYALLDSIETRAAILKEAVLMI